MAIGQRRVATPGDILRSMSGVPKLDPSLTPKNNHLRPRGATSRSSASGNSGQPQGKPQGNNQGDLGWLTPDYKALGEEIGSAAKQQLLTNPPAPQKRQQINMGNLWANAHTPFGAPEVTQQQRQESQRNTMESLWGGGAREARRMAIRKEQLEAMRSPLVSYQ